MCLGPLKIKSAPAPIRKIPPYISRELIIFFTVGNTDRKIELALTFPMPRGGGYGRLIARCGDDVAVLNMAKESKGVRTHDENIANV